MATKKSRRKRLRQTGRPIFDSIRKPSAPPGHPMSHAKPDEKARPAGRKAKHKQKPELDLDD
ncbi:MAG TPA: hypothetical protein VJM12_11240 [Pyrinomonadaceae bacterium]|nr:hypothetical protein [Pyrinomonadaceae bacterium]